ncbi:hypothetical protein CTheo_8998 [Ceratobasidium theobromae]|uniref:Uncharacterized protein n=1 Tax=Ceratobasidium theobromae TaxID=1582974 RepID=A0A5N5Q7V0_9AGAM|nr:hypothetical protein CTheo_8998 [Ceratobasidium theobromae]
MESYDEVRPFNISVPDEQLHDLRTKLDLTRLPDELDLPAGQEWEWGIPLAVVKPLVEYWRNQFDWRAVEERINRTLPQFTTFVDSLGHGPQEVSKMIDELANPKDPKHPSFHVVAPSLPGFVFSQRASTPGMNGKATAYLFNKLMHKLGYKYYMAQGGDWGVLVCRCFAVYHQDACLATHINANFFSAPSFLKNPIMTIKTVLGFAGLPGGYSKDDIEGIKASKRFQEIGSGYMKIQGTRPQTLAMALTDSPVGLLAWVGEKLHVWTDSYPWQPEEFITWIML